MKKTKNIIGTNQAYVASYHLPDEEYDYFYLDFITYPPGIKKAELENEENRVGLSNKFGKHAFRICFSNGERIDELIEVLEEMKRRHKSNLYFQSNESQIAVHTGEGIGFASGYEDNKK